jgi:hypothetical protein
MNIHAYKNLHCLSRGEMATIFVNPDYSGDGDNGFYKYYEKNRDNSNLT